MKRFRLSPGGLWPAFLLVLLPVLTSGCYAVQQASDYYGLATGADNVVFVLDVSGSMEGRQEGNLQDRVRGEAANRVGNAVERTMGGVLGRVAGGQVRRESTKLGAAKRELIPALRGLPEGANFGLVLFGEQVRSWRNGLTPTTAANKNAAALHVNGLSADGGTPMREALERAFGFSGVGTIILVTDGQPTDSNADAIRARVRALNGGGRVVVHTVGLGGDQDEAFLSQLASENGGRYVRRP